MTMTGKPEKLSDTQYRVDQKILVLSGHDKAESRYKLGSVVCRAETWDWNDQHTAQRNAYGHPLRNELGFTVKQETLVV